VSGSVASLSLIALLAFLSLGLPDGVLGVAWPSMRRSFELPMSQLGVLLTAAMVGYLGSSVASGTVVARMGLGRVLVASSTATAASAVAYALAPGWEVVVLSAVGAGLGAGAIDAGINAFAASHLSPRLTSWLHASYGVGAALGPLLTSIVLATTGSWRIAYGLIGLVLAMMTGAFARTAGRWTADAQPARPAHTASTITDALRRPAVWRSVTLFFVVGAAYATHAIGFQVAAFYLGTAVLPGAASVLARHRGLDMLGPFLFGTALGLGGLYGLGPGGRRLRSAPGPRVQS
jgi:MFS family permease